MADSILFNRNKVYTKNELGENLHEMGLESSYAKTEPKDMA